jgi:hypothetical protein
MFYQVKVKFTAEPDEKGKSKTRTEIILVEDVLPEGAINQALERVSGSMEDYEITGVNQTKVNEVILNDDTLKEMLNLKKF